MSLPPLANVVAVLCESAEVAAEYENRLRERGIYDQIWRPFPLMVAASVDLPGLEGNPASSRSACFAFAEGRDLLDVNDGLAAVAERVDHRPETLSQLPGDFGFIRFRPDGATVVRSCGGLVPFYISRRPHRTIISSRFDDLIRLDPGTWEPDPLVYGIWASGHTIFPDQRCFVKGVQVLRAGTAAIVTSSKVRQVTYWDPQPMSLDLPSASDVEDHQVRLRTLLLDTLRRELDPAGDNLLSLSGGVDSTSLAALSVGVLGISTATFSILPEPRGLLERELSFIQPLVAELGIERAFGIRLTPDSLLQLPSCVPPTPFFTMHPTLLALSATSRQTPTKVLFGGEFADEVCGWYPTMLDWSLMMSPQGLFRARRDLPNGAEALVDWAKLRIRTKLTGPRPCAPSALSWFLNREIQAEFAEWRQGAVIQLGDRSAALRQLQAALAANDWVAMNWEFCSLLGIRRCIPFHTRAIMELAFQVHPSERVGPSFKKLLRLALIDDVPRRNLFREDKGSWGQYLAQPGAGLELRGLFVDLLCDRASVDRMTQSVNAVDASLAIQLLLSCGRTQMDAADESAVYSHVSPIGSLAEG